MSLKFDPSCKISSTATCSDLHRQIFRRNIAESNHISGESSTVSEQNHFYANDSRSNKSSNCEASSSSIQVQNITNNSVTLNSVSTVSVDSKSASFVPERSSHETRVRERELTKNSIKSQSTQATKYYSCNSDIQSNVSNNSHESIDSISSKKSTTSNDQPFDANFQTCYLNEIPRYTISQNSQISDWLSSPLPDYLKPNHGTCHARSRSTKKDQHDRAARCTSLPNPRRVTFNYLFDDREVGDKRCIDKIIQDATSSNDKLMAMKNHHPTAKLSFSSSPVTPPPHQNLIISQSRTPTNRQTSNNQQSNSQQSSPGGPNSVDSGNSSGKAHDLSHSSNSSTHSDEVQQNTMVRTTGNPENSRKNTPISENSVKAPEFGVADVITLSLVRQCRDSWYQPNLSRDRAINKLKTAPFGAFIIRDSTSFVGGYGLAIRVKKLPDRIQNSVKPGMPPMDLLAEHVRHYLIESVETTPGKVGYQIKGNLLEPVYPNLDMLVYKHILESISLPISLDLRLHAQHLPKTHKLLQNVKNSEKTVRSTVETEQGLKKTSNASKTSQRSDSSRPSLQSPNLPEKTVKTTSFSQHVPDNSESSSNNQLKNQFQYNQDSTLQNTLLKTRQKISVQNTPPLKDTTPPSFPVSIKQQKSASVSTTKNVHVANEPFDLKSLTLNNVNETLNSINSFGFAPSENNTMRRTASHNPQPSHALGTGIGRMTNTQTIYSCHLVYIGCRDCEKLAGPAAVERSLNTILTNNKQNSSLIGFKIQKSGFTLTDEARKLFFRKHFNRKQLLTCDMDPKTRQLDVSAYSGLAKPAHLFGVVVQASGSQNQCHILAEVDQSVSTAVIVAKIRDFINEQK